MNSSRKYLLTIPEYAKYERISQITIKRRIWKNEIPIIKVKGGKGHRKNHAEIRIHYTELSREEARERFLADRGLIPEKENEVDKEDRKYVGLTPKQRTRFDENSQVLKIYQEALQGLPSGRKTTFSRQFAKAHGMSESKLRRVYNNYIESGIDGLIPKWNPGIQKRRLVEDEEVVEFIGHLFMAELGPSILEVYQRYQEEFGDKRENLFSRTTVADFIRCNWSESERLLAREPDKWKKQHGLWVNRDWDGMPINECWFSDAKQIDICCNYNGRPIFPWFTAFMDARSRKFVGWVLTASPDSWAIAQAFDYAIAAYGVPKLIYIDRGKPYKSHLISGGKVKGKVVNLFDHIENEQFIGIFRELRCEIFFAYPRNPKEKIVEPNFGIFTDRLRHLPGYRGHSTKHRPLKLEREIKQGKIVTFDQLYAQVNKVIEERNARPHSTTHRAPNSYYEGFVPVVPSESFRAFLRMDRHWVKIRNGGVRIGEDFYRGQKLFRHSGLKVEVRRDPANIRKAAVIQGNELLEIAHLEPVGHYRSSITLKNRETVAKLNKKIKKERERIMAQEEIVDDPLIAAMEMGEEVKLRGREVRPGSNVMSLHRREKLARKTVEELKKVEPVESKVVVGGKLSLARFLTASTKPREVEKPRVRVLNDLSIFNRRERDEDYEDFDD